MGYYFKIGHVQLHPNLTDSTLTIIFPISLPAVETESLNNISINSLIRYGVTYVVEAALLSNITSSNHLIRHCVTYVVGTASLSNKTSINHRIRHCVIYVVETTSLNNITYINSIRQRVTFDNC